MRWFTCTPVRFQGGPEFFSRDSGLLSRGFQAIGVESRAVMPGPARPGDEAELIRTEYRNLESADWWRQHDLDGVALYAWGRPKFRKVAAAIREAGVFLVLNQDNGGLVSPLNGVGAWLREQRVLAGAGQVSGGWMRFAKLVGRGLTVGLAATDPLRAKHLKQGDIIACVSPAAADHYRRLCGLYGGKDLSRRVRVVPHPVNPVFHYDGSPKERTVVMIGRWDVAIQKRPEFMMEVVGELAMRDLEVSVDVIGQRTPGLNAWHASLDPDRRDRIRLRGKLPPSEIRKILARAQVSYCPSSFESFHIASGEALCSGCSVVASQSASLASFDWFCGEGSGRLAESDDMVGHVTALGNELDAWASGRLDASKTAALWQSRLHAPKVAKQVISLAEAEGR